MPNLNTTIAFSAFIIIWLTWSIWTIWDPILNSAQLAFLIPLFPLSSLLLAFSFLNHEEDDNDKDRTLQPIFQRIKF